MTPSAVTSATREAEGEARVGTAGRLLVGLAFLLVATLGISSARLSERIRVDERRVAAATHASDWAARVGSIVTSMERAAFAMAASGTPARVAGLALRPLDLGPEPEATGYPALDSLLATGTPGAAVAAPVRMRGLDEGVVAVARVAGAAQGWAGVAMGVGELADAAGFEQLDRLEYAYLLRPSAPDADRGTVLVRSSLDRLIDPIRVPVAAAGDTWTLELAPRGGWSSPLAWWPSGLAALLAAFIAALFIHNLLRQPEHIRGRLNERLSHARRANDELVREIERRKEVERGLSFRAGLDEVTGLPARQQVLERLERALARARFSAGYGVGVLHVGIDRFVYINESLGPENGDDVLREVAERIDVAVRPGDTVARVTGDRFAALLYDVPRVDVIPEVAARIREAVAKPIKIAGQEVFVTCSVGIAHSENGFIRPGDLLKQSESAMYAAKENGPNSTAMYDAAREERAADIVHIEAELRRAIREDQLSLRFQPIIRLEDGALAGAETLVRWEHPLEGMISPGRFIPFAEESHLIIELDRWVLRHAAEQAAKWRAEGVVEGDFYLSVNLSGKHIAEPDIVEFIRDLVETSEAPPGTFRLEVTEGVVMARPHVALRILEDIRALGVPLLLDDFGTGYSSLSYLHRFPFDVLKIDRSFVSTLTTDVHAESVVRAITSLAHTFGMTTVGEGAEAMEEVERLKELDCTYVQGYVFARPLTAGEFEEFVAVRADPVRL